MRKMFCVAAALAAWCAPRVASAEPVVVPAGAGQRALAIATDSDGIYVLACDDPKSCDPRQGTLLRPADDVRAHAASAKIDTLELEGGKRAALITIKPPTGTAYVVLLASPDKKDAAPRRLFSGAVGRDGAWSRGVEVVRVKGKDTLTITTRDAFCGVDVLVSKRKLDAATLTLKDEAVPDPAGPARGTATAIAAELLEGGAGRHAILSARTSSSGDPSLAVDGDPKTAWVEKDSGPAARPFVTFAAASDVPIVGLDLVLSKPLVGEARRGLKKILISTDAGSFAVTLPEDAALGGGRRFGITLPKPILTKCVGLVVDETFATAKADAKKAPKGAKVDPPRAYISEVQARTSLDAVSTEELAKSLGGQGPDAKLREAILLGEGATGARAAIAAYAGLDGPGRDRARRVIDASPCEEKLALYVPLLIDKDRAESDRARDWVRRCGKASGPALLAALDQASLDEVRGVYAEEAALVAPEVATKALVARLDAAKSPEERRVYRKALEKGALRDVGVRELDRVLDDPSAAALGAATKIDVLRALGPSISKSKRAPALFSEVSSAATEFRDRYLLLGPAAELARGGSAAGGALLEQILAKGEDPRLRARAAELAGDLPALKGLLIGAIDDEKVRVREAALLALTSGGKEIDGAVRAKLIERLEVDPWTFVRRAAAAALAGAPKDPAIDARIAAAVDKEEQPSVRAEMVAALGARGALPQASTLRARASDSKEAPTVRSRAIEALGAVCDAQAADLLTELAARGRAPMSEQDRKLGAAAVAALVALGLPDLPKRLAPLMAEGASPDMKDVAERALKAPRAGCK